MSYRKVMDTFTLKSIPNLDVCVLAALELLSLVKVPKLRIPYKKPLVVGSGNAAATGKILFERYDAVFADESTAQKKLKSIKAIDGMVLISASGGKHAPTLAKLAQKYKKKVTLITTNKHALAIPFVDKAIVFPKNREPYTYNTSTYMSMLCGLTQEDPKKIMQFIEKNIHTLDLPDFSKYKKYFLVIPGEFSGVIRLFHVKFIELFGRKLTRDIEAIEYMKHAVTVVPDSKELFISFGKRYTDFGEHHLHIPLPKNTDYVAMMAIGYYVIGMIQAQHPAWFKQHISTYTQKASELFKQEIKPIVE